MLRSAYIQPRSPFRPIGDTPPLSLTRQLSPDRDEANCLLLECGDIRNILFTIFCNAKGWTNIHSLLISRLDPLKFKQLHFLCSDQEDAIIGKSAAEELTNRVARNVLFLSLLLDETFDVNDDICWAIYFDVSIDSICFDRICQQASQLVSLSANISDWHDSKYGRFLTFADEKSLHNVRAFWQHYHSLSKSSLQDRSKFSAKFMKDFLNIFQETFDDDKSTVTGLRAFGATFIAGLNIATEPFTSFWTTGIVGQKGSKIPRGYFTNPLFVYSAVGNDQCSIHFGTNPILAFHCASALADIKSDANENTPSYSDSMTDEQKLARVVKTAKIQFKSWCSTFREVASSGSTKIAICHYTGEPLPFCYALQRHINVTRTNLYEHTTAPWNFPIVFDKNAKLESYGVFDVIDATGFIDTIPIPVVLISTIPLLQSSADATIFTSKFESSNANYDPHSALKSQWFCDPIEMFTLFGLAPAEYITRVYHNPRLLEGFTPLAKTFGEIQTLWRFSWKRVLFGDFFAFEQIDIPQPIWDADSLATVLHKIYDSICVAENHESLLRSLRKREQPPKMSGYTGGGFVAFLQYLTLHIKTEWSTVFSKLSQLMSKHYLDHLIAITKFVDFGFHLHRHNLSSSADLKANTQNILSQIPASWRLVFGDAPLQDTMSFIFRIPRAKLDPIVKYVNSFNGSHHEAVLQINISSRGVLDTFSSFEMTFGTLLNADNVKDREVQVDNKGWNGQGDLFIFIHLPLVELFQTKTSTISLNIEHNSALAEVFSYHLATFGPHLLVFETEISNDSYFWPVANNQPQPQPIATVAYSTSRNKNGRVFADPRIFRSPEGRLRVLFRVDLQNKKDREELESGALVDAMPVSLCTVELECGTWKENLISPFRSRVPQ